jgi:hypothetical protein
VRAASWVGSNLVISRRITTFSAPKQNPAVSARSTPPVRPPPAPIPEASCPRRTSAVPATPSASAISIGVDGDSRRKIAASTAVNIGAEQIATSDDSVTPTSPIAVK